MKTKKERWRYLYDKYVNRKNKNSKPFKAVRVEDGKPLEIPFVVKPPKKINPKVDRSDTMGTVNINGVTYQGNSIVVNNGRVIIDGKEAVPTKQKEINIQIQGDVKMLSIDSCNSLMVNGDAGSVKTTSGDVEIGGNVNGSVSTVSGDVECGDIRGSVSTVSGDIDSRYR
ncbi:hypothetical protein [Halalkalibacter oceani]|uniref:hypothetical protein n=1 Tax=Halalkalibacter oceani TaxID=1653776 RepID=UPI003399BAD3